MFRAIDLEQFTVEQLILSNLLVTQNLAFMTEHTVKNKSACIYDTGHQWNRVIHKKKLTAKYCAELDKEAKNIPFRPIR